MEEAVLAQLEQHPEILKLFFQYNSPNDHRLIWAFYHLIAEQQTEMLSQPETLRHLIALTLNRGSELPSEVYFERYQQLLALCTPSFRPTRRRFRPNSTLPLRRRGRRWPGNPQTSCSSSGCSILRSTRWSSAPAPLFFNGIGLSPATISHHMSSLVSAGFIHVDKQDSRGFNLEAARVLFWRKKSRKQVTGLSAGNSLSI